MDERTLAQDTPIEVNVDNYIRAETDNYFKDTADAGGFGKFNHYREPPSLDKQLVIRMNRDTIYSFVILDLTEPATIVLPDPGKRFLSMQVLNEDQYTKLVTYDAGEYELTRDKIGTRYVQAQIRIFANPNDPQDMKAAHALQDAVKIRQRNPGKLELPNWDQDQRLALRKAILGLVRFVPDSRRMFGDVNEVDPVRFFIGTAGGWGGNRYEDAVYLPITPEKSDGKTPYVLTVDKDVAVNGFWSISVYNADGYFQKNPQNAYSVNNVTAKTRCGRKGHNPLRRRSRPVELPGDHAGMELHRPALSSAERTDRRRLEVSCSQAVR